MPYCVRMTDVFWISTCRPSDAMYDAISPCISAVTAGDVAHVAVLQAAMPTAVVSAIIAGDAGCDARLASAATVTNTLLALATLPLLAACLPALGL